MTPVCSNAQAFVVGPGVPEAVKTLAQFVDWARVNKTFYATPAAGSIMHFQGMVFSNKAKLDMTHAPYRGMAAIIPDLLSGTVATSMAVMGDVLPHIPSGKLRPLAVTSAQRSRFLPEVPTFAELGYGEVTGIDWYGLFVPAKTPVAIIDKLRNATHAAMKEPCFGEALTKMGFDTYMLSSDELAAAHQVRDRILGSDRQDLGLHDRRLTRQAVRKKKRLNSTSSGAFDFACDAIGA